jgi:hypothetical protein
VEHRHQGLDQIRQSEATLMTKYHATLGKLADHEGYDDVDQHFECRARDSCVPGIVKSVLKIAGFICTQSGD